MNSSEYSIHQRINKLNRDISKLKEENDKLLSSLPEKAKSLVENIDFEDTEFEEKMKEARVNVMRSIKGREMTPALISLTNLESNLRRIKNYENRIKSEEEKKSDSRSDARQVRELRKRERRKKIRRLKDSVKNSLSRRWSQLRNWKNGLSTKLSRKKDEWMRRRRNRARNSKRNSARNSSGKGGGKKRHTKKRHTRKRMP